MISTVPDRRRASIPGLRWWIVGLLFTATLINYLDRQTLSLLAPLLRELFGMTSADYSRVVFCFLLAYMLMQAGSGRLMDRLGTRAGFALTVAFWSVTAMLHAAATSVVTLGAFRFLLGLGEAGNWPGAAKAVSEWFPSRERALATGLFNSGSVVGALIAPPLVPWIALRFGWQWAFIGTGVIGLLWLVPWLLLYRVPDRHPRLSAEELRHIRSEDAAAGKKGQVRWIDLLRFREAWALVLARFMADPVWWFYAFWLPEYLRHERHFSLAMIGYFAWIPFLAAGFGSLAGGFASSRLIAAGWAVLPARKIVMLAAAIGMGAGIPAVLVPEPAWSIAFISVATCCYSAWAANICTLPADIFPGDVVASASGLSGTGAAIGGMGFTLITGAVVDRFTYLPIFLAAGVMPLVGAAILYWGARKQLSVS